MCEPWYQSQSPSVEDVIRQMQSAEFNNCLYKQFNTERDNLILCNLIREHLNHESKYITFESIRKIQDWREKSQRILLIEIEAHKPFGSFQGFATFVFRPLYKKYIITVIREMWAGNTIAKLIPLWLEKHYRPGEKGYQNVLKRWSKTLTRHNISN